MGVGLWRRLAVVSVIAGAGAGAVGSAEELFREGMRFQMGTGADFDLAKARRLLVQAADAGSAPAMDQLGRMYLSGGLGVLRDDAQAFSWFRKEADAGSGSGMLTVALLYQGGKGTPRDQDKARDFYERGKPIAEKQADAGDVTAMDTLAQSYELGVWQARNLDEAQKWLARAADAGDTTAMGRWGFCWRGRPRLLIMRSGRGR